ncbi:hypothetical protein MMC07_008276, partial [Pseudocyphellaria aurata]|nr:hypothetical protein [Pseudocyphellaria aurata]
MFFTPGVFTLVALALALPGNGLSTSGEALQLSPINVRDWEERGVQRREAEDFSHLDPKTQEQLVYGRPGDDGQLLFANMTLHAPNGMDIVMMERFEPLTKAVDCQGDDGSMSLTFKSEAAFTYALKTWGFINDAEENKFLLIANHDGCGEVDERQPYLITGIQEDPATLTTHLASQPASWSDIADHFEMDFGHAVSRRLKRRDGDKTASSKFSLNVGFQNQVKTIFTGPLGNDKIDCLNCFVSGTFQLTGHVAVKGGKLTALNLIALPQNVAATLQMRATLSTKKKIDQLSVKYPVLAVPIPGAGIVVGGIFKLGATVSYDLGITSSFKGTAAFDFGLRASLPGTAKVVADAVNPHNSGATGFEGYSSQPSFGVHSLSEVASVSANTVPKLAFGIDVVNVGRVEVAVSMNLPEIAAKLTGEYNVDGVCGSGSSKTGVKLDSTVAVAVNLDIKYALGKADDTPAYSQKLWGVEKPLFSKCYLLAIPGLAPGPKPKDNDKLSPASNLIAGPPQPNVVPSGSVPQPSGISPLRLRGVDAGPASYKTFDDDKLWAGSGGEKRAPMRVPQNW